MKRGHSSDRESDPPNRRRGDLCANYTAVADHLATYATYKLQDEGYTILYMQIREITRIASDRLRPPPNPGTPRIDETATRCWICGCPQNPTEVYHCNWNGWDTCYECCHVVSEFLLDDCSVAIDFNSATDPPKLTFFEPYSTTIVKEFEWDLLEETWIEL